MSAVKGLKRWQGRCACCGRAITGGIVRDAGQAGHVRLLKHRSEVRGTKWCEGSGSRVPCSDPDLRCRVTDCPEPVHSIRLCREHYIFNAAYGDPCAPRRRDRAGHELAMMGERLQKVTEIDLAYTAGLIDGEACITLEAPGRAASGQWKAGRAKVEVAMITPDVLRWLHETFGGTFRDRKYRQPGQRPIYGWCVTGKQVGLLLERLLPYFKVKEPQARVAIAFCQAQLGHTVGQRTTPEYLAVLYDLKAQMLELNRRGIEVA